MKRIFLIDNEVSYSYNYLLYELSHKELFYPIYNTSNLFNYFLNFIIAIAHNKDLVLVDNDLSLNELNLVDEDVINKYEKLEQFTISYSFDKLVKVCQSSRSRITIFTSGTTGQPKMIIHNIKTLTRFVRVSDKYNFQVWGFAYNPTHMAGLQVLFQALFNQNTLVNIFGKERTQVYKAIEEHAITHISATPTFYRLLLPFENSFNCVQRVTFGGEKSDEKLYTSIKNLFPKAKINNIYASTEAGTLFTSKGECFTISNEISDKIKVVNEELYIHKSLLGESENLVLYEDFYPSGDLIEWVDKEIGVFKFKSRKNELINIGGYNVNPNEVEQTICKMDGVIQAIVYGKTNSVMGNILCAEIKKKANVAISETSIRFFLSDKLQDFKIPRKIKFVDSFTLTRTGKIKR